MNKFLKKAIATGLASAMAVGCCAVSAQEKSAVDSNYIFGTVDLPYADYYYGELNEVAENPELQLNAEDKVDPLRAEGVLDAVSSATTSKWKGGYGTSYFGEHENGDGGGYIYGVAKCPVAIPKALYDSAKDSISKGETARNSVLSIVEGFTANEEQTVPTEYKVLNGDGTLTEMKDSAEAVKVDVSDKTAIENNTKYGHYQINIDDENLPQGKVDMQGVVIEAVDASGETSKYALLHLDNLWFQSGHIAWAAVDGFTTHGNTLKYKQFADIQGKTVTKVRYIVSNGADVEYKVNCFCKYLLQGGQGYSAENAEFADGAEIKFTPNLPDDSSYKLASVTHGNTVLAESTDYTFADNTLKVKATENTGVGTYSLVFTDDKYVNTNISVQFTSTMTAEQIRFSDNKIVIDEAAGVSVADYLKNLTSIAVNGSTLRSTKDVINEDGSVNFDAVVTFKGSKTVVFPDADTDYTVEIQSAGYPTLSGTVRSPKKADPTATEPTATEPTATEPTATEPTVTEPTATEPTATEPTATEPTVTEPTATEPTATEPTATEPTVTEPTATEPQPTQPTATEPTVTEPTAKKTTVKLAKTSADLYVKQTVKISATVKNASGKTTYKSNNKKVATVNAKGVVTAVKKGTAKITVTNNGVKKIFTVTVKNPKLNKTKITLKKGKSFTLKITGKVGKAKFTTNKKSVATVTKTGKITAKKKGSAVITVKTNGITLKVKVTVK